MHRHLLLWLSLLLPWLFVAFRAGLQDRSEEKAAPTSMFSEEIASTLPVTVSNRNSEVFVAWVGPRDVPISHFMVERQIASGAFRSIGGVNASSNEGIFEFQDMMKPEPESNSCYRIQICLMDGSSHYSSPACLRSITRNNAQVLNQPQPKHYIIRLNQPIDQATLTIRSIHGNVVDTSPWFGQEQAVSLDHLPTGVYLYHISNGQHQFSGKMIAR